MVNKKPSYDAKEQKMVLEATRVHLMSSDHGESGDEDEILVVKPLLWRSAILQKYSDELEAKKCPGAVQKGKTSTKKTSRRDAVRKVPKTLPASLEWTLMNRE